MLLCSLYTDCIYVNFLTLASAMLNNVRVIIPWANGDFFKEEVFIYYWFWYWNSQGKVLFGEIDSNVASPDFCLLEVRAATYHLKTGLCWSALPFIWWIRNLLFSTFRIFSTLTGKGDFLCLIFLVLYSRLYLNDQVLIIPLYSVSQVFTKLSSLCPICRLVGFHFKRSYSPQDLKSITWI